MTADFINNILKDVAKTLRLLVSLAAQPYDVLGLCNCLMSQIRHTVSLAMSLAQGRWDARLTDIL